MPPTFGGAPKCPLCGKSVYAAEQVLAAGATWHKACFKCKVCSVWLDSSTCCDSNGVLYCKSCYGKEKGPKGYGFAGGGAMMHTEGGAASDKPAAAADEAVVAPAPAPAPASADAPAPTRKPSAAPKIGGAPKCPVCSKSVYAAEQMLAAGGTFHKACFKCTDCNKWLDSSTCCDSGGTLYCKSCYAKNHGPKGFGIGNATVHTQ